MRNEDGYTLIEVLVALVISSVVLLLGFQLFVAARNGWTRFEGESQNRWQEHALADRLATDLSRTRNLLIDEGALILITGTDTVRFDRATKMDSSIAGRWLPAGSTVEIDNRFVRIVQGDSSSLPTVQSLAFAPLPDWSASDEGR